jgi:hypothetical protein
MFSLLAVSCELLISQIVVRTKAHADGELVSELLFFHPISMSRSTKVYNVFGPRHPLRHLSGECHVRVVWTGQ